MRSSTFSDITPCSLLEVNPCFGGTNRLNLRDRRNQAINLQGTYSKLGLLGLFFDPDGGGYMILRNVVVFRRTTENYIRDVIAQSVQRWLWAGRPDFESRQVNILLFSTA
jgi:hypothetical protein